MPSLRVASSVAAMLSSVRWSARNPEHCTSISRRMCNVPTSTNIGNCGHDQTGLALTCFPEGIPQL
eukprot:1970337-Karenia_brevis.AAC.1